MSAGKYIPGLGKTFKIDPQTEIEGFDSASTITDSTASDVESLVSDFNELLEALRAVGVIK